MQQRAEQEIKQASQDIEAEEAKIKSAESALLGNEPYNNRAMLYRKSENWISSDPSSQIMVLQAKRERHLKEDKNFLGFALERRSKEDDEFQQFITELKTGIDSIPSGTRISLAIRNMYADKEYDIGVGVRDNKVLPHWNNVELLIEDGQVHSFTLDAAGYLGYQKMNADLKKAFPHGTHYFYEPDDPPIITDLQSRRMQSIGKLCRTFAIHHIAQLSQISSSDLFFNELPTLTKNAGQHGAFGIVTLGNFKGGEKLLRIVKCMQDLDLFETLPTEVKKTVIREKDHKTLESVIKENISQDDKQGVNSLIFKKNILYMRNKQNFWKRHDEQTIHDIIRNRQGFMYTQHPILFSFSNAVAKANLENVNQFIDTTVLSLKKEGVISDKLNLIITRMNAIKEAKKDLDLYKNELLICIETGYASFSKDADKADITQLDTVIAEGLSILSQNRLEEKQPQEDEKDSFSHAYNNSLAILKELETTLSDQDYSPFFDHAEKEKIIHFYYDQFQQYGPWKFNTLFNLDIPKDPQNKLYRLAFFAAKAGCQRTLLNLIKNDSFDLNKPLIGNKPILQIAIESHLNEEFYQNKDAILKILNCVHDFEKLNQSKDISFLIFNSLPKQELVNIFKSVTPEVREQWLIFTISRGFDIAIPALLEAGVDCNKKSSSGVTALFVAAEKGNISIVQQLLEHKADFNTPQLNEMTPLFIAAEKGHTSIVKLLLEKKADCHLANEDKVTPLFIAAQNGHFDIVKALLEAKADYTQADEDDMTPLSIAVKNKHADIVKILFENKADFSNPKECKFVLNIFAKDYHWLDHKEQKDQEKISLEDMLQPPWEEDDAAKKSHIVRELFNPTTIAHLTQDVSSATVVSPHIAGSVFSDKMIDKSMQAALAGKVEALIKTGLFEPFDQEQIEVLNMLTKRHPQLNFLLDIQSQSVAMLEARKHRL